MRGLYEFRVSANEIPFPFLVDKTRKKKKENEKEEDEEEEVETHNARHKMIKIEEEFSLSLLSKFM